MILTDRPYLHEHPSSTSSVSPGATAQAPLSIARTTSSVKVNSYLHRGDGGVISPTVSAKEIIEKTRQASATAEHHPVMPNLDKSPRKASTGEHELTPSNDSPTNTNHSNSHESIANGSRKLFVGGLPTDVTQQEFQAFFAQFGELQDAIVMFDRDTKCSRGFGFVTYVDPEVSLSLLRMGDANDGIGRLEMRGKMCEVKAATPKGEGVHNPRRGRHGIAAVTKEGDDTFFRFNNHPPRNNPTNDGNAHPHSTAQMGYAMTLDPLTGPMGVHSHYLYPSEYSAYGMASTPYYAGMGPPHHFGTYLMDPCFNYASVSPLFSHFMPQYDHVMAPHYYPAHNQQHFYAAMMPTNAGMNLGAAAASIQTSVMQPVAPGIPGKEEGNQDAPGNTTIEDTQE